MYYMLAISILLSRYMSILYIRWGHILIHPRFSTYTRTHKHIYIYIYILDAACRCWEGAVEKLTNYTYRMRESNRERDYRANFHMARLLGVFEPNRICAFNELLTLYTHIVYMLKTHNIWLYDTLHSKFIYLYLFTYIYPENIQDKYVYIFNYANTK